MTESDAGAGGQRAGGRPVGRRGDQVPGVLEFPVLSGVLVLMAGKSPRGYVMEGRTVPLVVAAGDQQDGAIDPFHRNGRGGEQPGAKQPRLERQPQRDGVTGRDEAPQFRRD
jgi:hypothetical protein